MPDQTKGPAGHFHTVEVVVLKRFDQRLRLLSPRLIAPGTAAQLRIDGKSLECEVVHSSPPHAELSASGEQEHDAVPTPAELNPGWDTREAADSVMGSLMALNARLLFHEEREQAN